MTASRTLDLAPFDAVLSLPPDEIAAREHSVHSDARFTLRAVERFALRIDRSGGPDACWLWLGNLWNNGYARPTMFGPAQYGHRTAYALALGPIPRGLMVRHAVCGERRCLNPSHLAVGTAADNTADALRHGTKGPGRRSRIVPGEEEATRRELLVWIEAQRRAGATLAVALGRVAERYGITRGHADVLYRRGVRERARRRAGLTG